MNKKEMIQALINGNRVRYEKWSNDCYIIMDDHGSIKYNNGSLLEINAFSHTGWEIYQEPKPKQKFYRRKWLLSKTGTTLLTERDWFTSKELFDKFYDWASKRSEEWEEIEV